MPEQRAAEEHVVEVGDDVVGVGLLRVGRRASACTPESPPMVNIAMKPIADSIAACVKRDRPPHIVAIQLMIFTPVGTGDEHRRRAENAATEPATETRRRTCGGPTRPSP